MKLRYLANEFKSLNKNCQTWLCHNSQLMKINVTLKYKLSD